MKLLHLACLVFLLAFFSKLALAEQSPLSIKYIDAYESCNRIKDVVNVIAWLRQGGHTLSELEAMFVANLDRDTVQKIKLSRWLFSYSADSKDLSKLAFQECIQGYYANEIEKGREQRNN